MSDAGQYTVNIFKVLREAFRRKRKQKEKTDFDIVSVTLYNADGIFTPVDASLAGRCGYARLNATPVSGSPVDSADDS
jgi:hypothetical protein